MLHNRFICMFLLVGVFGITGPAAAQSWEKGAFVTGSIGASAINFDSDLDDVGDGDHSGFTGRIAAGYWFSTHWGISVNYADLGDFEQEFATGTFRGSARSYGVSLLGRWPLGERWALIGKVNLLRTEMDDNGSVGVGFGGLFGEDSSVVLPSLEVNYRATDELTLLVELDVRGPAAEDVDLGYVGMGARWHF